MTTIPVRFNVPDDATLSLPDIESRLADLSRRVAGLEAAIADMQPRPLLCVERIPPIPPQPAVLAGVVVAL